MFLCGYTWFGYVTAASCTGYSFRVRGVGLTLSRSKHLLLKVVAFYTCIQGEVESVSL